MEPVQSQAGAERVGREAGYDELNPATTRRRVLQASAAAAAGLALPATVNHGARARAAAKPFARDGAFGHVAAGFPQPRSIVLWTRLSELDRTSRIGLEVARDPGFRRVVKRGAGLARSFQDFTVHKLVGGLEPDTEYHYRFFTDRSESRVGRFRTAPPPDSMRPVTIAFFSCQKYHKGYYNIHSYLAGRDDIDLVLCLGDYIYEEPDEPDVRDDNTGINRDGDVQTLDEYRQKWRFYQSDPDLQAMHANHAFVGVWDDHEIEDNWAGDDPSPRAGTKKGDQAAGKYPIRRVTWRKRLFNGRKAFFEAQPRKRRRNDAHRIYESARLGLVDLFALDTRQYRDQQPCGDETFVPCPEAREPGRTLLGERQKSWLKSGLSSSEATWRLLGNQVMMMGLEGAPGFTLNVDAWDGYAAERNEMVDHIIGSGSSGAPEIRNVVSLVGDIHTFFAGSITDTGNATGRTGAVELVGGSVTSPGIEERFDGTLTPDQTQLLVENLETTSPHITYANFIRRGCAIVTCKPDELLCEFRASETITERNPASETLARFRVPAGSPEVQEL